MPEPVAKLDVVASHAQRALPAFYFELGSPESCVVAERHLQTLPAPA